VLKFGVAQRIRDYAERKFSRRFAQGWLFLVVFSLLMWVLNLPMDFYEGFVREHQYGMSNHTFGTWMGDHLKGLLVSLVLMPPIVSLLYLAIRRSPDRWWVRAGIATPFFMLFFIVLAPVFVSPLFNKYTPLADAKVRDPILSMARANSVPAENVYQFDASRQTKRISANVSGALGTIRVSLNDNLLHRCTPAEVQAVMGHELGHYVLNHVYKHVLSLSVLFITGFWFTHWFFGVLHRRWGAPAGVRDIADFAGLPLLSAALAVFMFLATPVRNTIIRTAEQEADVFGLNAARQPDGFASTALKLAEYRKLRPGPWEEKIFYDHPSGYTRILTAMRWKAEHLDESAPAPKP
jgi:STE24 endopeptidase